MRFSVFAMLLLACVKVHAEIEGFVVGGNDASIEKHPHSALLNVNCNQLAWICSASILNQQILLSAGHCLYTCTIREQLGVFTGSETSGWGHKYLVENFMMHEKFNPLTSEGDICLIKLRNPLILNKKTSRVAVLRQPPYNEICRVAGWGLIDDINEIAPTRLQWLSQNVLLRNDCKKLIGMLLEGTICAGAKNESKYVSNGDSGSALVVRGYIQIALVSHKLPSLKKSVVVYTDVGYYYEWIYKYSASLFCNEV